MKQIIITLLTVLGVLASCATTGGKDIVVNKQHNNTFLIKHIEKHRHLYNDKKKISVNTVYVLLIERNDTLYPLYSHYDKGNATGEIKLKPGMYCNASLESHLNIFRMVANSLDIVWDYYGEGLALCPDFRKTKYRKCYTDVFTSPDLNGLYWKNQ